EQRLPGREIETARRGREGAEDEFLVAAAREQFEQAPLGGKASRHEPVGLAKGIALVCLAEGGGARVELARRRRAEDEVEGAQVLAEQQETADLGRLAAQTEALRAVE